MKAKEPKSGLVVKDNKLIEASYRLDLVEQRIILAAIVEARQSQKGLGEGHITLEAKRFAEMFGMEEGSVYGQLKDAMDKLFNRFVVIRDTHPESGHERVSKVRWISTASYIDGAGAVQLRFATDMVPYITRLESEFTAYRLEKIGRMSSAHAVRLYELLVQHLSIGAREMTLADLKRTLGLEGEYAAIKDFKKWVLDVAVKQINEHTDLRVSYENIKTGRSVTGLLFTIEAKPEAKPKGRTKHPPMTREYVAAHSRPGESWDAAERRLLEERGQQRLVP